MEYAEMQAIAEVYLALKQDHTNEEIAALFEQWNEGESKSYLLGITADILKEQDPEGNGSLLDEIVDVAHNKGTGRWTGQQALEQEYDASVLLDAYLARAVSNLTDLRSSYEVTEQGCPLRLEPETLHRAYDLTRYVIYAQGFGLYRNASMKYSWNLDLSGIAAIFRAGCIIQCRLLDTLSEQLKQNDDLFMTDWMMEQRNTLLPSLRKVILGSVQHGIPMPVMNGALTFMDQLGSPLLGANLIQAQRDYFGAHTFQRIGSELFMHHDWEHSIK
jgi:6-phosphogluconate dehydrogenase